MARPLKEKSPLTRAFSFKTTEENGAKWDAKIASSGYSKSEFFRMAVEDNETVITPSKKPITHKPKRTIDEQKILFLLAQQSNNINQIAHQLNTAHRAGIVSPHVYMDVLEQLETITEVAKNWRP